MSQEKSAIKKIRATGAMRELMAGGEEALGQIEGRALRLGAGCGIGADAILTHDVPRLRCRICRRISVFRIGT